MINTDPTHIHTYDAQGNMTCCSLEEKINANSEPSHTHDGHDHAHGDHDHSNNNQSIGRQYLLVGISFLLLITGIVVESIPHKTLFNEQVRFAWYLAAYLPVGLPVLKEAFLSVKNRAFFSEFLLMSIATIGAFAIGEYAEGVTVMVFYSVGELFQTAAVSRAKRSVQGLMDIRPEVVSVTRNGQVITVSPAEVKIGELIQVKAGEKLALDGRLRSESASFNTAALTGESIPATKRKDELVLAGMINLDVLAEVEVTALFKDSKLSQILDMVQHATARKSKTQLFISRFARIYTPIVVGLAFLIAFVPLLLVAHYQFSEWLYRALVFLVISCPCALVISIPLGYFGGIGLASRNGILFKGGNYLDVITTIDTVVFDKTGTLTKGVFTVQEIVTNFADKQEFITLVAALESKSTHPVAKAIVSCDANSAHLYTIEEVIEIPGYGLKGRINNRDLIAGSTRILQQSGISYPGELDEIEETLTVVAIDNQYAGYFRVADELKPDAKQTIEALHQLNLKTVILSGDKYAVVARIASELGIDTFYGDLLPDQKVAKIEEFKAHSRKTAFVGDGINDAPSIALADVGMAMGGLGSDAAIETADVVIQDDQPSKIPLAIQIGKETRKIILQNIYLAFGVKLVVLILGAGGIATLWEAVFADVGVALLAILNAMRIQRRQF